MSLSKETTGAGSGQAAPRQLKCNRCRHHGIIVPQKGHMNQCPFIDCTCWKCHLITQRKRVTAPHRNVKKVQHGEQRPRITATVGAVEAAAEGAWGASAAGGSTHPSGTSWAMSRPSGGALELAGATESTGGDSGKVVPYTSREEAPCTPSAVYSGAFGQTAPLPLIPFPFGLSGHPPRGYAPCLVPVFNMAWFPAVPPGLYSDGLPGPLMVPYFQPGAVGHPPPPEHGPPADGRRLFFTLQPPPPLVRNTEQDLEELD